MNKKKKLSREEYSLAKELGFSKLDFAVALELKKALYWEGKKKSSI